MAWDKPFLMFLNVNQQSLEAVLRRLHESIYMLYLWRNEMGAVQCVRLRVRTCSMVWITQNRIDIVHFTKLLKEWNQVPQFSIWHIIKPWIYRHLKRVNIQNYAEIRSKYRTRHFNLKQDLRGNLLCNKKFTYK